MEHLLLLPLCCSLCCFSLFCSLLVFLTGVFKNMLSQRCNQLRQWDWLYPVVDPLWSWVELSVSGIGQLLTSSQKGHPCRPPHTIKILQLTPKTLVFFQAERKGRIVWYRHGHICIFRHMDIFGA